MNSRRNFVKMAATALGGLVILPQLVTAQEKRRAKPGAGGDAALPFVEPGKGMAASVNYQTDHNAVKDPALKADRSGVKFADQHCDKCMLYTKIDGGSGKCSLFASQKVKSSGWCSSWAKKA